MRVGLQVPRFTWPGSPGSIRETLDDIASTAEDAGFDSIWVMDHFFQIRGVGEVDEPMLEGYTTLGHLAALTDRVRLGTLVTGVIYREPALLVKEATTLDVLSAGRAYLGIGAGWFEREAVGLGVRFPPTAERFERLEEALQIAHQMWSGDDGPYHGDHYHLEETLCRPQPLQAPHPPILIGGMGERKTLRMVAQYADACNLFVRAGLDVLEHKLEVLQGHCQEVGRSYDEIEKTTLGTVHLGDKQMSPSEVVDLCGSLSELGIDHAIFNMPNVHDIEPLETFGASILPQVSTL
ncbi:MAG: LLM class F420-dependent oxidoreductase [Anaerolineales bacterium]